MVASSRPEQVHADLPHAIVVASPADACRSGDIDVVVIATPTVTHAPIAAEALEAGRHVVVEKPLADTLAAARRLLAIASRSGRLLATFQNRRWDGDFFAAREIVRGGALGAVTHFESHFDRYRPEVRDRWRERPGPGAGVWNDLGPHLVDQALQLFGLPAWVSGRLATRRMGGLTDDWAHVVLGYEHRAAVLHASMLAAANLPRFIVHGERGSWTKDGPDPQEFRLAAEMGLDIGHAPGESAAFIDGATGGQTASVVPAGDYRQFYVALRAAILGEGLNPVPPAEAIAAVAIVETAARSSAEGRVMALPLTDEERQAFDAAREAAT